MFIDANDKIWHVDQLKKMSTEKPLSVCFMDQYGNSFLQRVKECMGKPVVLSLSVPFECFVEQGPTQQERRRGFLMVNDYQGMMFAYGFLQKWKEDYIPLLTRKDTEMFRQKRMLCFLDYGAVYIEWTKNKMLDKGKMAQPMEGAWLNQFGRNPKRYYYQLKRGAEQFSEKNRRKDFSSLTMQALHQLCLEKVIRFEGRWEKKDMVVLKMEERQKKEAFKRIADSMYIKKGKMKEEEGELWVLGKVPVLSEEENISLTIDLCKWLNVPFIHVKKAL